MDAEKQRSAAEITGELSFPGRTRIPRVRCAMEYTSAYDRKALRQEDPRLAEVACDLIGHAVELLSQRAFTGQFLSIAWKMLMVGVVNGSESPATPLTKDLVPIPSLTERAKRGWDVKAQREFAQDKSGRVAHEVVSRLQAIRERLATGGIANLSDDDHTSLVQLSEAILASRAESLASDRKSIREKGGLDLAIGFVEKLSAPLGDLLSGDLARAYPEVLSTVLAHRLAVLHLGGLLDSPKILEKPLHSRLVARGEPLDARTVIQGAGRFVEESQDGNLEGMLRPLLPVDVVPGALSIIRRAEREVLCEWLLKNQAGIEARYVELVQRSLFAKPGTPQRLSSVVQSGRLGSERARTLEAYKLPEPWNPAHHLSIHHPPCRPPRILEAAILTGAPSIEVMGIADESPGKIDDEMHRLLELATLLSKYDQAVGRLSSVPSTLGSGELLLKLELDSTELGCEGRVGDREPPRAISALERHTGGSIAWIAHEAGDLVTAIIFDGQCSSLENEWKVQRVSDVVHFVTPKRRVTLVDKTAAVSPTTKDNHEVVKVPQPLPAPTHILSQDVRDNLIAWLDIAENGGLFAQDPTFSGSPEATATLDALRRAAKGQAINSRTFRSLKKLSQTIGDTKRRPLLRAPQLHGVREELGAILKSAFSADS